MKVMSSVTVQLQTQQINPELLKDHDKHQHAMRSKLDRCVFSVFLENLDLLAVMSYDE